MDLVDDPAGRRAGGATDAAAPADLAPEAIRAVLATAGQDGDIPTSVCPGCGAVLAVVPGLRAGHPGASAGCAGLFEVTVRGLREEAAADLQTAAVLQLATDAYDAQHPVAGQPAAGAARLCLWVARGLEPTRDRQAGDRLTDAAPAPTPPDRWTTTIADVAADLDVVDLPSLVRSWADAVWADWSVAHAELCAAADAAQRRPG